MRGRGTGTGLTGSAGQGVKGQHIIKANDQRNQRIRHVPMRLLIRATRVRTCGRSHLGRCVGRSVSPRWDVDVVEVGGGRSLRRSRLWTGCEADSRGGVQTRVLVGLARVRPGPEGASMSEARVAFSPLHICGEIKGEIHPKAHGKRPRSQGSEPNNPRLGGRRDRRRVGANKKKKTA